MLNIRLNLKGLLRGPGRRRLPDAYETAVTRIAELQSGAAAAEARHQAEIKGLQSALREAATKYTAVVTDRQKLKHAYDWNFAEVKRLNRILAASDGRPGIDVQAAGDHSASCFNQPDPSRLPDFRISDIPPGPADSEAADVSARTQLTDVRTLRQAWDATAPAVGPIRTTWGVGGSSTRPPLPDEAPTERLSAITAVLPLFDHTIPVAVELSKVTGERARDRVHAEVGGPQ